MANPISSKDLFKGNIFSGQAKGAESLANSVRQLISALDSLKEPIKQSAKESKKFTDSINLKNIDTKKLVQLEKEYEKLKKGLSDTEKINKQLKKSQTDLVAVTEEQTKSEKDLLKEKLKKQKADREEKKNLKALITLEDKLGKELKDQADVLENLNDISKLTGKTRNEQREISQALRTVVSELNEEIPEQAEAINQLNEAIDRNDEALKSNADSYLKQKINIGGYAEGVKEAFGETEFFNTGIGKLDQILNALTGQVAKTAVSVVGYEKSTEGAAKSTTFLGRANQFLSKTFRGVGKALAASGLGAIIVALGSFAAAISTNRKEALEFQIVIAKVSNFFGTLTTRLGAAKDGIVEVFKGLGQLGKGFIGVLLTPLESLLGVIISVVESLNDIPGVDVKPPKGLQEFKDTITELKEDGAKGFETIEKGVKGVGKAFDGTGKSIEEANKLTEQLLRNQFNFADQQRIINREIAETNKQREIAQALSDDDTDSLKNIIKFRLEAERLAEKELNLRIELAQKELKFTEDQLRIELQRADATGATANEIRELVKSDEKRFLASETALQAQQEALLKLSEVEKERDLLSLDNINKRVKAQQDLFEQNLDFLIDVGERNRAITEAGIADETKSFETRFALFEKLKNQFTSDLDDQANEFDDFAGKLAQSLEDKIDSGLISDSQIEGAKKQLETLRNFDIEFKIDEDGNLIALNDGTELSIDNLKALNEELQSLGLGEIPVNRIRDVVVSSQDAQREIKTLGKDIDLLKKVTKGEIIGSEAISQESLDRLTILNNKLKELINKKPQGANGLKKQVEEIEKVQQEITAVEIEETNKRAQNRIDAINRELEIVAENSERGIALQEEKNELEKQLLDSNLNEILKQNQKEIDAEKKKAEELKKIQEATFQFIEDLTARQFEKKLEVINAEIEANKQSQDQLRELAQLGSQNAEENLAFEKQRGRELELERQKTQEAQARTELFLALLKATSANIANGDEPQAAILKALSSGAVLQKAANVLPIPGFYEGTENLTKKEAVATRSKSKDPFLIWGHPGERIIDHKKNAELGNYSNEDLVDIVKSFDKGVKLPQMTSVNNYSVNMPSELTEEIKGLKSLFPRLASDLDKHTGIMTTAIRQGNKVTNTKRRTR